MPASGAPMFNFISADVPSLPIFLTLCLVAFIAGIMRGFSGFGGGLLIAPVYSLFMPPADVVVLVIGLNLLTTIQLLPSIVRAVDWSLVFRLFIPSMIGVPIGVALLHSVDAELMRKVVAFIVTAMASLMLLGWRYEGKRGRLQDGTVGLTSGLLTSIGGIGGPPTILYLLSDPRLSVEVFRTVCLMLFFLIQIFALAQIGFAGSLTQAQGGYILILLPAYVLAHWVGAVFFVRYVGHYQAQVRQISLWLLLFVGFVAFAL